MQSSRASLLPLVFLLLYLTPDLGNSARILGVFPHVGKSHFDFFEPLMKTLAQRGHDVVVISHFPQKKPIVNYTDISLEGSLPDFAKPVSTLSAREAFFLNRFAMGITMALFSPLACNSTLSHPPVQELISSDQHFDLVMIELFHTDCTLGFAHKFQAPYISMTSSALLPHTNDRFGNPDNPSYIPLLSEASSDKMTFRERFMNTVHYIYFKSIITFFFDWIAERYARMYFGDSFPPLKEIQKNASLIFVNTHFSINKPRPLVPGVIEVAGLHIPSVKKLPQDLQEFMDGAKDGVIYFSMGSLLKPDSIDDDKRQALVDAFSEIPQRVLWKWDADVLPGLPSNVKIARWLPQFDILNHPNLRLYIGHGGQLGMVEAAYCGVPMIGIPMLGDQPSNVRHLEVTGNGIRLDYSEITKENVLRTIRTILIDPSYRETAKRVSQAYHDRPMSPMDTAVYWTEYVIRHRGAPHLRSAAVDLNIFQYLLLDVIATILIISSIILFVLYKVIRKLFTVFRHKTSRAEERKKVN